MNSSDVLNWSFVISILSLVVSTVNSLVIYLRFRKERPIIKVDSISCTHKLASSIVKRTDFDVKFYIKNIGHVSTTLMELVFKSIDEEQINSEIKIEKNLDAHSGHELEYSFKVNSRIEKEKVDVLFMLRHTHGIESIKTTSTMI